MAGDQLTIVFFPRFFNRIRVESSRVESSRVESVAFDVGSTDRARLLAVERGIIERNHRIHRRFAEQDLGRDERRRSVPVVARVNEVASEEEIRETKDHGQGGDEGTESEKSGESELEEFLRARGESLETWCAENSRSASSERLRETSRERETSRGRAFGL